ncbi:Metallopeptidase ImmA [compost metagenome]
MRDIVNKLTSKYKTNCPFELAAHLNIDVSFADLGKGTRGFYYKTLGRKYICIHKDLPDEWKRFVCAHELGHERLHKGMTRFFVDENSFYLPGKLERQANYFAITLLLGNNKIKSGESVKELFLRSFIPLEMQHFYKFSTLPYI